MRQNVQTHCPDDVLAALSRGETNDSTAPALQHVSECHDCNAKLLKANVARMAAASDGTSDVAAPAALPPEVKKEEGLAEGTKVGRYLILKMAGAGGMGVVYAAYDATLNRRVALKVMRASTGSEGDAAGKARLLREGQALAQLAHPNVVSVFEMGTFEDRVFIAMEFVEGQTLREWVAMPRPWREIVSVFLHAGAGLAAAHAAGIVHRDFKLDNVLLGKAGRVYVMDFGIARGTDNREEAMPRTEEMELETESGSGSLSAPLTQVGAVIGTRAYMAPEQFDACPADARSDQFSFCVALYRALFQDSPFPSVGLKDANRWSVRPAPRGSKVPSWLFRIVERGLQRAPDKRYPSMEALLADLRVDVGRKRQRTAAMVAGGVLLVAAAAGYRQAVSARTSLCTDGVSRLAGTWDAAAQQAMHAAFLGTKDANAESSWTHTRDGLSAFANAWAGMHDEACAATRIRGDQSDEVLSLRMACLDRRLGDFKAAANLISSMDAASLPQAVKVAQGLPGVSGCADIDALRAPVRLPDDARIRAEVGKLQKEDAEVQALLLAGRYAQALQRAQVNADAAEKLGYRPLEAELLRALAVAQMRHSLMKEADVTSRKAVLAAEAGGHVAMAASIMSDAGQNLGRLGRFPEAREAIAHARAFLEHLGESTAIEANIDSSAGVIEQHAHAPDAALKVWRRALLLSEKAYGRNSLYTGQALNNVGIVLGMKGEYDECTSLLKQALEVRSKVLGPTHPETLMSMHNLGILYQKLGRYDESSGYFNQVVEGAKVALTPKHFLLGYSLEGLAENNLAQGEYEVASGFIDRSLAIQEATIGSTQAVTVSFRMVRAIIHRMLGKPEKALELLTQVRQQLQALPEDLHLRSSTDAELAASLSALGRYQEALAHLQRCESATFDSGEEEGAAVCLEQLGQWQLEQREYLKAEASFRRVSDPTEKKFGPDSNLLARPLIGLGEALLGQGKLAPARVLLERGLKIAEAGKLAPELRARARFGLAKIAWDDGTPRDQAKALAARAVAELSQPWNKAEMARVEQWLAKR